MSTSDAAIVLASVAFEAQIINENFFAVLVLTAIATSLLAGWWLGNMAPNTDGLRPTLNSRRATLAGPPGTTGSASASRANLWQ